MDISCVFFGIMFTLAGLLFALGRLHIHLAAWKSMTDDEKNEINIKPLVRNIGIAIMLCGIIFLLKGFIAGFVGKAFVIVMIIWLIFAGCDVWYISKSKRYKSK